ncbi:glycosyltransferase family 4 protein [Cedecea davisae]|uniref:glycosyltransferase family 4 protein n=1 Tax=Cedecea davisae TaxID=158484 RepID=UPI00376F1954
MKIAIILPSLHRSGPGIQITSLIRPLMALGAEIDIFYIKDISDDDEKLTLGNIHYEKINLKKIKKQLSNYNVIHSNGFYPDLITACASFLFRKTSVVSSMHNFIFEDFNNRYGLIKGACFSLLWATILLLIPNKIVFTKVAESYYKRITNGHFYITGSGVSVSTISELATHKMDSINDSLLIENFRSRGFKVIGSTSIISKVKNLDLIVKALTTLDNHIAVFIGGGPTESELRRLSQELGVADRVLFLGFKKNLFCYMKYFDVVAMPSVSESFGLSLFEAIACKVPVICRPLPIFKELLNENDVLFFDGSVESFVEKVNIDNKNEYANNAYNTLLEKYEINVISKCYYNVYAQLIKK